MNDNDRCIAFAAAIDAAQALHHAFPGHEIANHVIGISHIFRASAVRAAAARNCEILRFWRVISIADMLPAPRINDMLHRVTFAAVWESPRSQVLGQLVLGLSPTAVSQQAKVAATVASFRSA
jgi:hypothetical protein